MQEQLMRLGKLYAELIVKQKELDAAKVWCLYNRLALSASDCLLTTIQRKVSNLQNEIDNILFDLLDKYGDKFETELERIIFARVRKRDVAN